MLTSNEDLNAADNQFQPYAPPVALRAVGDILMISGAAKKLAQEGIEYPFSPVASYFQAADIAFGNLEMPIRAGAESKPAFPDVCPDFFSPPEIAAVLKETGFTVVNLANNHMMDWGTAGLHKTIEELHAAGIQTIGAGDNLKEARRPAILERRGLKIGFLGYSEVGAWVAGPAQPGVAPINLQMISEDIQALRPKVDLLVVSLHTGIYSDYPSPEDRRLARGAVDEGADLILGHGPHVLQGIELYHERGIVFSMGNFMIDLSSGNVENKVMLREHLDSMIVDVSLFPGKPASIDYIPVVISEQFQVLPAGLGDAARIRSRVDSISRNLDEMSGLALWEHAGARNVEHQFSVFAFQMKNVSWFYGIKRLKKLRWRHIRLVVGYLFGKIRKVFGK